RSPEWIATEYANQSDPAAFYTVADGSGSVSASASLVVESILTTDPQIHVPVYAAASLLAQATLTAEATQTVTASASLRPAVTVESATKQTFRVIKTLFVESIIDAFPAGWGDRLGALWIGSTGAEPAQSVIPLGMSSWYDVTDLA